MIRHLLLFLPALVIAHLSNGQVGGRHSFKFLDVPVNARLAGIGGMNVSLSDLDVNLFMNNPAALNKDMDNRFSVNYLPYFADIKTTTLAYAKNIKGNTWGFGMHYMDYGTFDFTLEDGTDVGTFQAREYAFIVSRSHTIDYFTIGVNMKLAGSNMDTYDAWALMADVGGIFNHPEKDFTVGLTFKNIGYAIKSYTGQGNTPTPFDVRIGTSFKPEHMPFRFSATAHHLLKYNILYDDPTLPVTYDLEGNVVEPRGQFFDNLARHFIVGGEFLLSDNFNIRVGYNYLRRREMRLPERGGVTGLSLGFMFRMKSLEFAYSKAFYHMAGGTNNLTLTANFDSFFRKKEIHNGE